MILSGGGQDMVQPSSGGGGGAVQRLFDIISRNQNMAQLEESRKRIITHQGQTKVETERQLGENRIKQGIEGRKAIQDYIFKELPDNHPDVLKGGKSTAHPVTNRHYADPVLADWAIKSGVNPDPKGQLQFGAVSAINLAEKVSQRKNDTRNTRTKKEPVGKSGTIKDTYDAYKSGYITKDQARDLHGGMDSYLAKRNITGPDKTSEINKVNKNVNNLGKAK